MKPNFHFLPRGISAAALLAAGAAAVAVTPRSIVKGDFAQLGAGELESAALTSDGFLIPSFDRKPIGETGAEIVWDAIADKNGSVLTGTGHSGLIVRVDEKGTSHSLGAVGDKEITALLRLADGTALAAGAPSGRIYHIGANDALTTAGRVGAAFVWKMAQDKRGDVWAATGPEGRLFRLKVSGATVKAEEIAKLESANLLDLWIDDAGKMGEAGSIYVGGQDPGWVYRVAPSGKPVEVLFNAQAEEVRAIAPIEGGLALALNTERAPTPQALQLTLRMAGGQVTGGAAQPPAAAPAGASAAEQAQSLAAAFAASRRGQYGQPRSEVTMLGRNGFSRLLWTSPDRPVHDLAAAPDGGVLASAGSEGRVYRIAPDGKDSVVADVREDYVVAIVASGDGYILAGARNGALTKLLKTRAEKAIYLSDAIDARSPVAWGSFYVRGDVARGQRVRAAFRTGNDGDVDSEFWSQWTEDQTAAPNEPVAMPAGPSRFMQYRLTLESSARDAAPPRVDEAELFYQEPNAAPLIREFTAADSSEPRGGRGRAGAAAGPPPAAPPAGGQRGAAAPSSAAQDNERDARSNTMQVRLAWQASDPNDDTLRYSVYFKGENEAAWKLIEDEISAATLTVDVGGVADGRYRFKLIAEDMLANAPGLGNQSEKISDSVTIDNTAPAVERLEANVRGNRARIQARVADELSILAGAKIDIDNGDGHPMAATDGMIDQPAESFELQTDVLAPGEHVATLAVTDRRGNSTVKKIIFTVDN